MKSKLYVFILVWVLFMPCAVFAQDDDKASARENLDQFSSFAYAIDPTYGIEKEDISLARKSPNTKFAIGIGLNSTYKVTKADKEYLRKNPNTLFAYALAQNSNYVVNSDDKRYIDGNSSTLYAFGLSRNPSFTAKKTTSAVNKKANKTINSEIGARFEDGSRFLFTRNFKLWLSEKGVVMPDWASNGYGLITDFLMTPFDMLDENFELFDFFRKPISQWNGWSIIHAFLVMSFLSVLFVPRPQPNK